MNTQDFNMGQIVQNDLCGTCGFFHPCLCDVPIVKPKTELVEVKEVISVCCRCGNFFPISELNEHGNCGCQ